MSEVVERVAKAIYDAADPTSGDCVAEALMHSPFVGAGDTDIIYDVMAICRSAARAAILALREPNNEMLAAMHDAMFVDKFDGTQLPMLGAGFDAAIDEALR
jgi:hypothetical protein